MNTIPADTNSLVAASDWVPFAGGELEGQRPRALCPTCRDRLSREANSRRSADAGLGLLARQARRDLAHPADRRSASAARPLCFQCYRADLERLRTLKAAGQLDTASDDRFQEALPLEPVNRGRLNRLKLEHRAARLRGHRGRFVDRRRRAQINARHVLERLAEGLRTRNGLEPTRPTMAALHGAELQLPESWLPFVASR